MNLGTVLVIILVLFLIGGVGPWSTHVGGYGYGFGNGGIGVLGFLVIMLVILVLTGRL